MPISNICSICHNFSIFEICSECEKARKERIGYMLSEQMLCEACKQMFSGSMEVNCDQSKY